MHLKICWLYHYQGGIASNKRHIRHKSNDNRRTTINLGVGHRLLVEDDMAIVGINVFTDYERKLMLYCWY
jgi:hypothetical protein